MDSDREELRELYAASHIRLVVQVTALTASVEEAEDAVNEAFARAWARWQHVRGHADPEAWVRAVAFNVARDRWRRARRQATLRLRLAPQAPAPEPSAEHVDVLAALAKLPAEQREAVVAHHMLDLSVEEVAAQLGVPAGTVKARLARGRRALAALLDPASAEQVRTC